MRIFSQTDTASAEEDFSMYENFDFAEEGAKRYCTPKVFDLSPAKLISLGYDLQGAFNIHYGIPGTTDSTSTSQEGEYVNSGGLRFSANIPVISRTNVVWQLGVNYAHTAFHSASTINAFHPIESTLQTNGLTTSGIQTTLFKPINAEKFLIVQGSADLNGDYTANKIGPLKYTRYSAAFIFGKKVNDRKMIGFGLSRTYRVGELNYIPVMLLNWTAPNRKWGVEALVPARIHVRKTLSPRNILLFGYELEGNSYRLMSHSENPSNLELRRSELRIRAIWETSIRSFLWLSFQMGYRHGYSFNIDQFNNDKEFFRGFFGDQPYFMENTLHGTWYAQLSLNLVSP